jgi:hypothetical protein
MSHIAEPGIRSGRSGARLAVGVALVLMAIVVYAGSQLLAARQRHAYDPGAKPSSTYRLTAGKTYQLSAAGGVSTLTDEQVLGTGVSLACTQAATSGAQDSLKIDSTKDDIRELHVFATFIASKSGSFHISCEGIPEVFLDDADNSAPDRAGALLLLATALGLIGTIAALSGGYALGGSTSWTDR